MTAQPGRPIYEVADKIAERLFAAAKRGSISRVDIDIIRGACEIAAHYEGMDAVEYRELEDKALRKIIAKVG